MRFFLQMGHGMMRMNLDLLERFDAGQNSGVIMWPRTLDQGQVERHAREIRATGASLLFDSCFYVPTTSYKNIMNMPYWNDVDFNTLDFAGQAGREFCQRVIEYQLNRLDVTEVILPGRYANTRNEHWLEMHYNFANVAVEMNIDRQVYTTLALGPDLIKDSDAFDGVINEVVQYPVDGVYLVYHAPKDAFLVDQDLFMYNLLVGCLSLTLSGKEVILGFANQQDLMFAAAGVCTLATGNYRNVRSFDPTTFENDQGAERRRATWYYDGQSLSEFRLQQLSLAYSRLGMMGSFGPETVDSSPLLRNPDPGSVRWTESDAFKHYITAMREQWLSLQSVPSAVRYKAVEEMLQGADERLAYYEERGMRFLDRAADTKRSLPAWLSALGSFVSDEADRLHRLRGDE